MALRERNEEREGETKKVTKKERGIDQAVERERECVRGSVCVCVCVCVCMCKRDKERDGDRERVCVSM